MEHFLSIAIIFGVLNALHSQYLNQNTGTDFPLAIIPTEENNQDAHDETSKSGLSPNHLSDIHDLAKNISHSKGFYRQSGEDGKELRRSIARKVSIVSESDVMKKILFMFESSEDKLILLEQMEDLVHQFDVAVTFATMGGLKIISSLLFSDNDELVKSVALVLGSAMQSNPAVQKLAMEQNVGKKLIYLLSHKSPYVVSRILFAISSFLRNAPKAQEEFLLADGVARFAEILKNSLITMNTKLKIINLLNDLAVELTTAKHDKKGQSDEQINVLQRSLAVEIDKYHICDYIATLLELEDYDSHQKVVDAMLNLEAICHKYFKADMVKDSLKKLLKIYYPGNNGKNPLYPDIDEELQFNLYNGLGVLYEKINDDANVSSYKYFTNIEL